MPTERAQYLIQRFFDNTCTPAEMEELATLAQTAGNDDETIRQMLEEAWQQHTPAMEMPEAMSHRLLTAMFKDEERPAKLSPVHRVHFIKRFGWWAAAAVLLVVSGLWFVADRRTSEKPELVQKPIDITPGRDGAVLTLADGRSVVLDSLGNGVIATQGNTAVKINDGQLVYDAKHSPLTIDHSPLTYNTMTTPRGRQFRLLLPDGTAVWLNAGSSITYPTQFNGTERKVSITGEAYFEVAKNAAMPFIVNVNNKADVEVLGTHFNINSYTDEDAIRTTLLEGKVKVSVTSGSRLQTPDSRLLIPGEQAIMTDHITVTNQINVEEIMAWKNGIFFFRNAGLPLVMKQLERWYNIDVQYKGKIPTMAISGKMDRGLSLQEILDFLAKMDVKYSLTGRTITINGNP